MSFIKDYKAVVVQFTTYEVKAGGIFQNDSQLYIFKKRSYCFLRHIPKVLVNISGEVSQSLSKLVVRGSSGFSTILYSEDIMENLPWHYLACHAKYHFPPLQVWFPLTIHQTSVFLLIPSLAFFSLHIPHFWTPADTTTTTKMAS